MSIELRIESLVDSYKIGMNQLHNHEFFLNSPTKVLRSYSNFTARKNAYFDFSDLSDGKIIVAGTRHTFQYIHELFTVFFVTDWDDIEYFLIPCLEHHFGGDVRTDHAAFIEDLMNLHELGYLPLEVRAVDEGTRYNIGLPLFTVKNTEDGYGWLVNNIETIASNTFYGMTNCATIIDQFYLQAKHYGELSAPKDYVDIWLPISVHNFEARGMFGTEHSLRAGFASCIPFIGSDTFGTFGFLQQYYDLDFSNPEALLVSVRASEHADVSRLLSEFRHRGITEDTELHVMAALIAHTKGIFSYVSDTENYFRTIGVYAKTLKDAIMARQAGSNGLPAKFVFRPDSSPKRPLEVIAGDFLQVTDLNGYTWEEAKEKGYGWVKKDGEYYQRYLKDDCIMSFEPVPNEEVPPEVKGSLNILWEVFGGEELETEAGTMKFLHPAVGLIYGEAISMEHQKEIYEAMIADGFSATNLVIGKGSYANLKGNTRDLFSMSFKQTFSLAEIDGEIVNLEQQKTPMGDQSKRSAKGLLMVDENQVLHQEVDEETEKTGLLTLLYKDGVFHKEQSIYDIKAHYFSQEVNKA